ncbi:hypothetical protein H5410_045934 [Solanum commersonii]|uniref:Reverse transcriptase domain-containing protein n=1 Tax=Solanum commersonii TaxID=4109 RepID=A0A9J5XE56_SOLCO|nr:hypothetical protein H5410_045934 [Solanum commersonii]
MDELALSIREKVPWCMLFADDIVLVDEAGRELIFWRCGERSGVQRFELSRTKSGILGVQIVMSGWRMGSSGDIGDDVTRISAALLYGAGVGGQNSRVQKLHVAEMRMLRWMCGHTRSDKIRNKVIRRRWEWLCGGQG